jgi:hypothetical protein
MDLLESDHNGAALVIARILLDKAKSGDLRACQLVLERTQGRPSQKLDLQTTSDLSTLSDEELQQRIELLDAQINEVGESE